MRATISWISLLITLSFTAKSQHIALQIGGANSLVLTVCYEQMFYGKNRWGTGLRLDVGAGYRPGIYMLTGGAALFFGASSNREFGVDVGRLAYLNDEYNVNSLLYFAYVGTRFGDGASVASWILDRPIFLRLIPHLVLL